VDESVPLGLGPPAAGKTTVAALLASSASVPTVHLTTDLFYRSIRTGFVLPFLPEAQRQNEVVIDAIVGTVATFARGGYDIVVDGIVGPWFLPPFRAAAEHDHLAMSYIVLRPDLDTTLSRARERVGELKDVEVRVVAGAVVPFGQDVESQVWGDRPQGGCPAPGGLPSRQANRSPAWSGLSAARFSIGRAGRSGCGSPRWASWSWPTLAKATAMTTGHAARRARLGHPAAPGRWQSDRSHSRWPNAPPRSRTRCPANCSKQ
jgi:hypothetical protein